MLYTKPLFRLEATVAPAVELGVTSTSRRRIVLVTGGQLDRIQGNPHLAWLFASSPSAPGCRTRDRVLLDVFELLGSLQ